MKILADDLGRPLPVLDPLERELRRGGDIVLGPISGTTRKAGTWVAGVGLLAFALSQSLAAGQWLLALVLMEGARPTRRSLVCKPDLAAALTMHGRCGACARPFGGQPADDLGRVECVECGAAWNLDRVASPGDPESLGAIIARTDAGASDPRTGEYVTDDRGLPVKGILSPPLEAWPARWLLARFPRWAAASLPRPRTWVLAASSAAALILALFPAIGHPAHAETEWTLRVFATGTLLCAMTLWLQSILPHAEFREELLKCGRCASCGFVLVHHKRQFDGCIVCVACHRAWKASRLGPPLVEDLNYPWRPDGQRPTAALQACPRCKYDIRGLPTCPECGFPEGAARKQET